MNVGEQAGRTESTLAATEALSTSTGQSSLRLLIVIVNYQSAALTIDCLESLQQEVGCMTAAQVVVVENASGDANQLRAAIDRRGWRTWCRLVDLAENRGFAAGNNAAIQPVLYSAQQPEFVLLLNPDTIVRPGSLRELLAVMDSHPKCGIAGSRLEDRDGSVQRSAFRFPSVLGELEESAQTGPISHLLRRHTVAPPAPHQATVVDWVAGAAMLVRKEVFDSAGLMDDRYFLYFEEVDFCKRAHNAGWECWYVPSSRVVHLVGQSSGVTSPGLASRRRPRYWFESRRRYFTRHLGHRWLILADFAFLLGISIHYCRCVIARRSTRKPVRFVRDFLQASVLLHPLRAVSQ